MRVYVDGVMAINFLVDLMLLLGTNRLAGFPSEKKRLAAASALGAVYSGACLLPGFRFLGNFLWRTVSLGLMGAVAFGCNRSAVRRCGIFVLLSLALGGFAVSLGRDDIWAIALSAVLIWGICRFSFHGVPGNRRYHPVEITYGKKTVDLLALEDTGNTLRDPISGEPVLVITTAAASDLTGLTTAQIRDPLATITASPVTGLRLIPFRTVGQGGMMLAMNLEVRQAGKSKRCLVAFAPEDFGRGEGYQALTGGNVC